MFYNIASYVYIYTQVEVIISEKNIFLSVQ